MTRIVHTRPGGPTHLLDDLVQTVLVSELLAPSERLWLVSPWVSDIPVVDNASGSFTDLTPGAAARWLRLSEILVQLSELGTTVTVVTRTGEQHNAPFLTAVRLAGEAIRTLEDPDLHTKALVTNRFSLTGSMNFTRRGRGENLERVILETEPDGVARDLAEFAQRFGGPK